MNHGAPRVSIIIPTYNEVDNVRQLIRELHDALQGMDYQIVVVDDNSPDGTYYAVKHIAERDSRILLLWRPGKLGLASAVIHGFKASNGSLVVMMDSDLSHKPHDLRNLLLAAGCADIVIGSRYVRGGTIVGMSPYRQLASRTSIWVSRKILGLDVRDTTSGFAVFRREVLDSLALNSKIHRVQAAAGGACKASQGSDQRSAHHLCQPEAGKVQIRRWRGGPIPAARLLAEKKSEEGQVIVE